MIEVYYFLVKSAFYFLVKSSKQVSYKLYKNYIYNIVCKQNLLINK